VARPPGGNAVARHLGATPWHGHGAAVLLLTFVTPEA
jgi:hypothetical protein